MNVCRLSRGIRLCVRVVCVDARVRVSLALSKGRLHFAQVWHQIFPPPAPSR